MELNKIYNMDCLEGLRQLPDKCVDLVVTDPPYDFMSKTPGGDYSGAGAFGKLGRDYHGELERSGIIDGFDRDCIMREVTRVMKKINLYIWCSKDQLLWYMDFFRDYNMELLTWHKSNPIPTCNEKYLSDTEYLLFFREKGVHIYGTYDTKKKYWLQEINTEDKDLWGHPTIKPLNIIETLIINSSQEGDIVLDPFMGSGTTAVACIKEKRNYIGYELNPEYYHICEKRVAAQRATLSLF